MAVSWSLVLGDFFANNVSKQFSFVVDCFMFSHIFEEDFKLL